MRQYTTCARNGTITFTLIVGVVPSICLCSPLPSGTWRTPSLSISWFCLFTSFLFSPFTVPCKVLLARPDKQETCPYHFTLRLFTMVRSSGGSITFWILAQASSLSTRSLYKMFSILRCYLISMARILFCSSAVRVYDSEAYVTRECISRIIVLSKMLQSFSSVFNLAIAADVCAILECFSGFESSSVITEPRYFKCVTLSSFSPLTLIPLLMPLVLFVINLIFSAWISMP